MVPLLTFAQQIEGTANAPSRPAIGPLHQTIAVFQGNSALMGNALAALGFCNAAWFTVAEDELMKHINALIPKSTYRKTLMSDIYVASNQAKKGFPKLTKEEKETLCASANQAYQYWASQGASSKAVLVDVMMGALRGTLPTDFAPISSEPVKNPGPTPGQDSEYLF